ncbi:MAG: hypothetical protein KUG81_06545 [Gammaproteobacteria bacterium]|nr:hypothetical protein [Gammaproteobacteria bacterium]
METTTSKRELTVQMYNDLTDKERQKLQLDFGNEGIADRESKFYQWIEGNNRLFKGTIEGNKTHEDGYRIFHVWGTLNTEQISRFYASKSSLKVIDKYPQAKVYINIASVNLKTIYPIL